MNTMFAGLYERFGLNAYVQGDLERAEKWFRRLEAREPNSIRVLRNLGVIRLARGDTGEALRYLKREEALYGPSFHRHAALADLAYSSGDRKEAGRRYALALAEPEAAPGGRYAASRALLEARSAIAADPAAWEKSRTSIRRFAEAEAKRDGGDPEAAYRLFREAADLDPTNWPALNNSGSLALNAMGDPEAARELFSRALSLSPGSQVARNLELAGEALARRDKEAERRKGPRKE
jgi:tetratricopeptide (TPR) repeat protein